MASSSMITSSASAPAPAPAPGQAERAARKGTSRLVALDGLRGVAALVVVIHHVYQIARPYLEPAHDAWAAGSLWWALSATPAKLLTAGSEAVLVFFVLSGVVVPLPALRGGRFSWAGYLVSRVIRLCVPVWAALAFATVSILAIPRDASMVVDGSWVERANGTSVHVSRLVEQALLSSPSYATDPVLWSLHWELVFSLLLPVFLVLARLVRRFWVAAVLACFALTIVAKVVDSDTLRYLPVFFVGTLIAVNLETLRQWAKRRLDGRMRRVLWWSGLVASLLAIVASWMSRPLVSSSSVLSMALGSLAVVGAGGLVACAICFPPVVRALSARVPQWLGRFSFSLYLVHLPIIVSLTYVVGDGSWPLVGLVGVPLSLLAAWGFGLAVEQPSHRLAQRAGRLVARGSGRVFEILWRKRAVRAALRAPLVREVPGLAAGPAPRDGAR